MRDGTEGGDVNMAKKRRTKSLDTSSRNLLAAVATKDVSAETVKMIGYFH